MDKKDIHNGHRERMTDRLLKNPSSLYDHEILEMMLYPFLPRIDTNSIAHNLLSTFGTIEGVLRAKEDELFVVPGIGKKTASAIVLLGQLFLRTEKNRKIEANNGVANISGVLEEVKPLFSNYNQEKLVVLLLDKSFNLVMTLSFTEKLNSEVALDTSVLVKGIIAKKPFGIVLVHNHPSGNVLPSSDDDFMTQKTNLLCEVHGIKLLDHLILHKDKHYSYRSSGRLDFVQKSTDLKNIIKEIKE